MRCFCQRGQFSKLNRQCNTPSKKKFKPLNCPSMDIQKLIHRYGSQQAVAKAFGVTKGAVSHWVKAGAVPAARLWQLKAGLVKPPQGR